MADVGHFTSEDIQLLFKDKHVVVIGDSVQRSVYKDLVCLLREDRLLTLEELKEKGEESFQEDTLIEGGVKTGLHNGTNYREVRKYEQDKTTIMFYFVTRCYGEYMQDILDEFKLDPPHVIIMNSCLWDLHRYGKTANAEYITNISELIDAIDLAVPYEDRLFIWNATLPVRETVKAGFLPPGVDHTLPAEDIRKANLYVRDQTNEYGNRFIFLDLHQTFYKHLYLRVKDGVHWNDFAHRKITCLILSEISKHWNFELPSELSMPNEEATSVSNGCSMNALPQSKQPRPLLDYPPPRNGYVGNGPMMNGGPPRSVCFPGNSRCPPRPPALGQRGYPGPRIRSPPVLRNGTPARSGASSHPMQNGHFEPRASCVGVRGPRNSCPPGPPPPRFRMNRPLRPQGESPITNGTLRNGPLGNAHMRGGRDRRGRSRSATVNPVGPRHPPPRRWFNGRPRFLNNNEYLPPRFNLNETFPPAFPGKRKYMEDDDFHRPYKFPRK